MEKIATRFLEISSRARGGKRPIKLILHRIMDSADDYQLNGISWKEEYVNNALETVKQAPITVEYINKGEDAEDTTINGHGLVGDTRDADGNPMPLYNEDSEVVGSITDAQITTLKLDGKDTRVLLATGVLYEHRCKGLVSWLKENVPLGNVMGSVEIVGTPENNNIIVYEDGYKEKGRVPMEYAYAGHTILSVSVDPADDACYVLEVNEKSKEESNMNDELLRTVADEIKNELHVVFDKNGALTEEVNSLNAEKDAKEIELNNALAENEKLKCALQQVEEELAACRKEEEEKYKESCEKFDALYAEKCALEKELAEINVKNRLAALDAALEPFTAQERAAANEQIEAFKADPINTEINTVTDVIYREIGKQRKDEKDAHASEQNEHHDEDIDIFSGIEDRDVPAHDDDNIF